LRDYLRLPTHKKYGWLVFLAGILVAGGLSTPFKDNYLINTLVFGAIDWALIIALIVELTATVLGKNKKA